MILVITVSVFLALSMGALALFWWSAGRQESLEHRLREVISPAGEASSPAPRPAWDRIARLWRGSDPLARKSQEIVSRVTGEDLAGQRLRLSQAGYRSAAAEHVYWWARIAAPFLLPAALAAGGRALGFKPPFSKASALICARTSSRPRIRNGTCDGALTGSKAVICS